MTLYYPPDIQACIFWLRNRRRRDWQEKGKAPPRGRRPDHQRARGRLERVRWARPWPPRAADRHE